MLTTRIGPDLAPDRYEADKSVPQVIPASVHETFDYLVGAFNLLAPSLQPRACSDRKVRRPRRA